MPTVAAAEPREQLERFLSGSGRDVPEPSLLSDAGLAGYGFWRSGEQSAARELRAGWLAATARHVTIRTEVKRLLKAWERAGIETLLFKGFQLAEFVYPGPGLRRYSDVDLLLRPRHSERAAGIAKELGWRELWHIGASAADSLRSSHYRGHEIMQLRHERLAVHLDVHRRLVHNNHNRLARFERQARITRLAWRDSRTIDWEGVTVRQLQPLDAVLVGLVLNRCWSPEDWCLRPHDYLDFQMLVDRFSLDPEALEERARELGCHRTYLIFLDRCDPFARRCNLAEPTPLERQRWNALVAPERGNRYLERLWAEAPELAGEPFRVGRELPTVARALLLARGEGDARRAADRLQLPLARHGTLDAESWRLTRRAVHRACRFICLGRALHRDLEALALLLALRSRAVPAILRWSDEGPLLQVDGERLNVGGTLLAE